MSKLLKQKTKSMVEIPFTTISSITFGSEQSYIVTNKGNKIASKCVGCKNHKCCMFEEDELKLDQFGIPVDIRTNVCPTDAISINKDGSISIDNYKCIECGLCLLRCPLGAIHLKNRSAMVEVYETIVDNPSKVDELKKDQMMKNILSVRKSGNVLIANKDLIDHFYEKFSRLSSQYQIADILVRNLFVQLGCSYGIRRRGDVINRIDGILFKNGQIVLNEVELSEDVLESPRAVLDDIAIYKYKFAKSNDKLSGLITLAQLPNSRAEMWRVIEDIKKVLNIDIDVVTIGTLLLLVWNRTNLKECKEPFFNNKTKNRNIPMLYKVDTSFLDIGYLSILETKK